MRFTLFAWSILTAWLEGLRPLMRRVVPRRAGGEAGMTTAEYAIGTIAACTFAALLIAIVRSPEIRAALLSIITSALDLGR